MITSDPNGPAPSDHATGCPSPTDAESGLPDPADPHLRLHAVTIHVRDHDRSVDFYMNQLGFGLIAHGRIGGSDQRWSAVAPPDGTAMLVLVSPDPDSADTQLGGGPTMSIFFTDDIMTQFEIWRRRGVRFHGPPQKSTWGALFAVFEDVDGNSFTLATVDPLTRALEVKRRWAAEKLGAERRAAHELSIARQVQVRLFPQTRPVLRTLDYAGLCIQARQVGGDYYDFLNLGHDRLELVVADVSGKGIAAALLMASLQASLRSQCAIASNQPRSLLRSVNHLFCENAPDNAYATLFFAEYDDKVQRLRYVNCGHWPALLLRRNNSVDRLEATGSVVGLFDDWDCSIAECQLSQGDTLALYTDGVTETFNDLGEEFGEERLIDALRRHRGTAPEVALTSIADQVRRFGGDEQYDDITLTVATCQAA